MRNHIWGLVALLGLSLLAGCGGGGSPGPKATTPPPIPALAITSGAPPSGRVGSAYGGSGFSLSASGGTTPYQWTWKPASGSSLPDGVDLSPSGLISGTPQVAFVAGGTSRRQLSHCDYWNTSVDHYFGCSPGWYGRRGLRANGYSDVQLCLESVSRMA